MAERAGKLRREMSDTISTEYGGLLRSFGLMYSSRARKRRGAALRSRFELRVGQTVLDLGGGDGSHIHMLFPDHRPVVVADIDSDALSRARSRFGYETAQMDMQDALPFDDKQFDFVFCSSVIEHTTGPKSEMTEMTDGAEFRRIARLNQARFAGEIARVAKSYWVQTPNKYFVVESHSWLPGVVAFLPRTVLVPLLKAFAKFWPKATSPDWNLLGMGDMRRLFRDASIIKERSCGLTKSLIAFKK